MPAEHSLGPRALQLALLLLYGRLHHDLSGTYRIPVENERVHKLQTARRSRNPKPHTTT